MADAAYEAIKAKQRVEQAPTTEIRDHHHADGAALRSAAAGGGENLDGERGPGRSSSESEGVQRGGEGDQEDQEEEEEDNEGGSCWFTSPGTDDHRRQRSVKGAEAAALDLPDGSTQCKNPSPIRTRADRWVRD